MEREYSILKQENTLLKMGKMELIKEFKNKKNYENIIINKLKLFKKIAKKSRKKLIKSYYEEDKKISL